VTFLVVSKTIKINTRYLRSVETQDNAVLIDIEGKPLWIVMFNKQLPVFDIPNGVSYIEVGEREFVALKDWAEKL
jgi:hypothetical protein